MTKHGRWCPICNDRRLEYAGHFPVDAKGLKTKARWICPKCGYSRTIGWRITRK